ncbi:hypothetical protein HWV62_15685 [Athelia sp. TMB]|nr:hypothetical protein HWV62_15685 [Athelia sp. TMB]
MVNSNEERLGIQPPLVHCTSDMKFSLGMMALMTAFIALSGQVGALYAQAPVLRKRSQCASTLTAAEGVATCIQSHWFNIITGEYSELWTDANTLEDIHNLMLGAGTTTWDSLAALSYIGRIAETGILSWKTVLGGSYDDAQWVMLALWKIADYRSAHGESTSDFESSAATIYDLVSAQWDGTCGGGVWWSSAKTYKNSITNHLYLYTSAQGYLRTGNATYLANAQKTWTWLEASGLRNSQNLWNDGLDMTTCTNNGETTWTYNQGVIASGLGALAAATGDTTLHTQAELTLDATISLLTQDNILKESCDDVISGGSTCDGDQQIFKASLELSMCMM